MGHNIADVVALVLNYNSKELTEKCVDNLLRISDDLRIVIVDNCSTDGSSDEFALKYRKNTRVYIQKTDINGGYAKGNNIGLKYISEKFDEARYILLLNPDIIVKNQETIIALKQTLLENEEFSIASCQIIQNNEWRSFTDYIWKFPDNKELIFAGTLIGKALCRKKQNTYEAIKLKNNIVEVDSVSGCFFMVSIDDLEKVGGFDERTFLYFEEAILAKRMRGIGKKIAVLIDQFVYHNHQNKDNELLDTRKKQFHRECFFNSKMVYINNYSNMKKKDIYLSRIVGKMDLKIKRWICKVSTMDGINK